MPSFPLPFLRSALALVACTLAGLALAAPPAAAPAESNVLGRIRPNPVTEPTVIAIPAFGRDDNAPVDFETMPRVIRRDLELSGFFKMPAAQDQVNSLNLMDTRRGSVDFVGWQKLGAQHLLMANISTPSPGVLRAYVLLYDVTSQALIINRNIDGRADQVRELAHRISDEVVTFTKNCDGVAQTKLLFISEQVPGVKEVGLMDADGFNARAITRFNSICTLPVWGANGTEFYYTSFQGNRARILGQTLASGQTWTIAAYGGTNHSPSWSQSAGRVLMTLSKDGNSELYSAGRDGSGLRRLTSTKVTEGSPAWSPDGRQIAFASNEAGGLHIYVAGADGGGRRRLTQKGSWNDAPNWSPDGQRIVFTSRIGGVNDVFTINADGNQESYRRLTQGQGDNESPVWAPNSRHIAFQSNRSGQWQIFMMLDDGSNQKQLTTAGRNTQPDWGPLPPKK